MQELGRAPLNQYGSLQPVIEQMRAHRPLDLHAPRWREAHPDQSHTAWAQAARSHLRHALHYDPGPLDLQAQTIDRRETETYTCERVMFNTTPWFRVPGYFYVPKGVELPAPALVVMHEWGGPMLFGAERVCGPSAHPAIEAHRHEYCSGRAIADWFASQGYCVICIDAFHFGHRAPRGVDGLPDQFNPAELDQQTLDDYQNKLARLLYLGVKQFNFAGTTWMGVNYYDDSRCVDYLLSRPEVDGDHIGVTGLSGGGWRTNFMAALDDRIKAAVSVGWMTTGDPQTRYNLAGAIGSFCLLPGVWNRMDVPDLIAMAAPKACMVVSGQRDLLFPPRAQRDAARQIADAYHWAGCPELFCDESPDKPHCYDAEIQQRALEWFDHHLKSSVRAEGSRSA